MKELGACPRCNGTDINTLNLFYTREEVCGNCGYVDMYKKHGAQNVRENFIAYVTLGLVCAGGFIAFLVMS
jgi:predicted nucleic-acid-binding Zn-ribbon protein